MSLIQKFAKGFFSSDRAEVGDLYADESGDIYQVPSGGVPAKLGSGGSQPGVAIVRKFPFAYNTAGILTGHTVYVPTIGDVLLDAWVSISTAWDGTTPLGDYGDFGDVVGWLGENTSGSCLDMTLVDTAADNGPAALVVPNQLSRLSTVDAMANAKNVVEVNGAGPGLKLVTGAISTGGPNFSVGTFVSAAPIKVCVSQDGTNAGANPGSTQGAAILYLVTATPA